MKLNYKANSHWNGRRGAKYWGVGTRPSSVESRREKGGEDAKERIWNMRMKIMTANMHTMGKSGGDHILEKVFLLMQYPHIERKQKLFFSEMHTEDSLPNLAQLEERGASGNSMTFTGSKTAQISSIWGKILRIWEKVFKSKTFAVIIAFSSKKTTSRSFWLDGCSV